MDMSFDGPVDFDALDEETAQVAHVDSDFCEVRYSTGEVDRFIRCLLPLPVPEIANEFCFGVWMSVSEASWNVYRDGFDTGSYGSPGCFGYLMHVIPEYEGSYLLHADVRFQSRLRPRVMLHETDHPLYAAQRDGVDVRQVERWVALTHRQ